MSTLTWKDGTSPSQIVFDVFADEIMKLFIALLLTVIVTVFDGLESSHKYPPKLAKVFLLKAVVSVRDPLTVNSSVVTPYSSHSPNIIFPYKSYGSTSGK